jgi:tellurite resistance protein TerC
MRTFIISTLRQARRVIVIVVGFTVLLIGVALLVLPGPAFVVIPIGLGILATEFVWARRLLRRVKREAARAVSTLTNRLQSPPSNKPR